MSALSVQLAPTNDTDANFRLWGKAISDQMLAGGWVKAADTGQINWATVTRTAVVNTSQGFEVWKSNDGGGGLTEFIVKLEFGSGDNVNNPSIWVTFGWTTDGAGTLTGVKSDRHAVGQRSGTANNSTSLFWSNLSTAPGRSQLALFTNDGLFTNASKSIVISIERLRNAAFAQTNNILFLAYFAKSTNQISQLSQVISPTLAYAAFNSAAPASAAHPLQADIIQANAVVSGSAGVGLQFGQMGGITAPSANVFGSTVTAMGAAQTNDIKITTFGTERNYIINGSSHFNGTATLIVTRFE